MDIWTILAWITGIVLGIGGVWKIVEKCSPKVLKYIEISEDALELAEIAIKALQDKKIDDAETAALKSKLDEIKAHLKE